MTTPVWPAQLPAPLRDGYSLKPIDPVLRTEMDGGNVRARRLFLNAPTMVPVVWRFTRLEFAVFEAWHREALLDGAVSFETSLFNGLGFQPVLAKFSSMWESVLDGLTFKVSASLLVRNRPVLSIADAVAFAAGELNEINGQPLHDWLHGQLPTDGYF